MISETHISFWYVVIAILAMLSLQSGSREVRRVDSIPYSDLQGLLKTNPLPAKELPDVPAFEPAAPPTVEISGARA